MLKMSTPVEWVGLAIRYRNRRLQHYVPYVSSLLVIYVDGGGGDETTVTLARSQATNQGCCECLSGSDGLRTYIFWDTHDQQRCVHTYTPNNLASDADEGYPVLLLSHGYTQCNLGEWNITSEAAIAARRYRFSLIGMCSLFADGGGGFGLEFGGNSIVNQSFPKRCEDSDSRDINYLVRLFQFIQQDPFGVYDSASVYIHGFSQESMWSAYVATCFPAYVRGLWQGGSGLAKTGYTPVNPGYQGFCDTPSFQAYESECCEMGTYSLSLPRFVIVVQTHILLFFKTTARNASIGLRIRTRERTYSSIA